MTTKKNMNKNFSYVGTVRFGCHIDGIYWDDQQGPGASSRVKDVRLTTVHGDEWMAKLVICTLPLGVLKRSHDKFFHPPLPPLKVQAIEALGFSMVEKVFLHFDKPFWSPGFGGIKLAWTEEDLRDKVLPRDWFKVICSFEEVYRQPSILAAWVSGPEAEAMLSLADDEVIDTCTKILRAFTGDVNLPAPVNVIRSRWLSNPLFYGSYSFPTFRSSQRSVRWVQLDY